MECNLTLIIDSACEAVAPALTRVNASLARIPPTCNLQTCSLSHRMHRWSLCSAATTTSVGPSCTNELSSPLAGTPYTASRRCVANSFESCLLYTLRRHYWSVEIAKCAQELSSMWLRIAQPRRCGCRRPQSLRGLQDKRTERSQSHYHYGVCKS